MRQRARNRWARDSAIVRSSYDAIGTQLARGITLLLAGGDVEH